MKWTIKMCKIKSILRNDVIEVICYENLKSHWRFGDIGTSGDIGTGSILARNYRIA